MTDTERLFRAIIDTQPPLPADAVVLLAGEDWLARTDMAVRCWAELAGDALLRNSTGPCIVITGGKHNPPRWRGALELEADIIAVGISPTRLIVDARAAHTREQAENAIDLASEKGWTRLLIVASPYHTHRAFLTFLKVLQERNLTSVIRIMARPANQAPWFRAPEGMNVHRSVLLSDEAEKIARYDVATYAEGVDYLRQWEGRL